MSKFEVNNKKIEKLLGKIGNLLKSMMPNGWGFTLLIFDYSNPQSKDAGSMFYISSAYRKDMLKAMIEFVDKQQNEQLPN